MKQFLFAGRRWKATNRLYYTNSVTPKRKIIGAEAYSKKGGYKNAVSDINSAIEFSSTESELIELYKQKAQILNDMGTPSAGIKFLEECLLAEQLKDYVETLKREYKRECGLDYGSAVMEKVETFMLWMVENGARFSKLRMYHYGPEYRGVHPIKEVKEDEVFLWVPKKLIITSDRGKETDVGKLILKSKVSLDWEYLVFITTFLLVQEFHPSSWWKPYIDVYPKLVTSFPVFFTKEEKELLRGSPMYEQIDNEVGQIREEYEKIVKAVPEYAKFPFEAYLRHKVLVTSRIFFATVDDKTEHMMVPLAGSVKDNLDMFNHHYEKVGQTYWKYAKSEEAFTVRAQQDIPVGEPVHCHNTRYAKTTAKSPTSASSSTTASLSTTIKTKPSTSNSTSTQTTLT